MAGVFWLAWCLGVINPPFERSDRMQVPHHASFLEPFFLFTYMEPIYSQPIPWCTLSPWIGLKSSLFNTYIKLWRPNFEDQLGVSIIWLTWSFAYMSKIIWSFLSGLSCIQVDLKAGKYFLEKKNRMPCSIHCHHTTDSITIKRVAHQWFIKSHFLFIIGLEILEIDIFIIYKLWGRAITELIRMISWSWCFVKPNRDSCTFNRLAFGWTHSSLST